MWPTQFMSNALRRISRFIEMSGPRVGRTVRRPPPSGGSAAPSSREQPPCVLRAAYLLHADRHRSRAVRHAVALDAAHDLGEGAVQYVVELAHHFALVPEELLQILHPFEVT